MLRGHKTPTNKPYLFFRNVISDCLDDVLFIQGARVSDDEDDGMKNGDPHRALDINLDE